MKITFGAMAFFIFTAVPAFAQVGGGDITQKNSGGNIVFSQVNHVTGAGQRCTACHDKHYTNIKQPKGFHEADV